MKYLKFIPVILMLFLGVNSFGQSEEESSFEINGFVRNYIGILFNDQQDFSIIQNTVNLELKKQTEHIGFYANPFIYHYPNKPLQFGLREMYIDIFSDKFDLRIGNQQIIWGQADGVFITDIVTPKDFTEFLLRDFSEIRIGVNAIKLNYYFNDVHSLELVWMPVFNPTIAPEAGSIWRPAPDFPAPPIFDFSEQHVPFRLENGEFFGRYSLSTAAIDLQLMGGYTWDDDPIMHVTKVIDPTTMQLKNLLISPQHHRMSLAGGSFSTEIGGFILRGEGAYYIGKKFQTTDPGAEEAIVEKDYLNYVVGLDKTIGDWRLSAQFIQKTIFDYDEYMDTEETENLTTLLVSKSMFREKVRLEWFSYFGINNQDAFSRLRVFYFPYDAMSIELGTNVFLGKEGPFGQYDNNDMAYARFKYSF